MKRQKVIVWVILSWVGVFFSEAKSQSIIVGVDCVSSYIWRGSYCGSVSIQPSLGIEYKGLTFGAWGSTDLTSPDLELDLALGYVFKGFEVTIAVRGDYYVAATGAATVGQSVLCDPASGTVTYGDAGATNDTGWVVMTAAKQAGDIIIISNRGLAIKPATTGGVGGDD